MLILEAIAKFVYGFVPGMLFAMLLFKTQDMVQLYIDKKRGAKASASETAKEKKDGII